MDKQTHWKKLYNPDYLGAWALEPGKDLIVTIKSVKDEMVVGADGKKEECMVMRFSEKVKPMILNVTNAKTIEGLYKTPYVEEWENRKIQLYAAKVKAFGEVVEALRIRDFLPKIEPDQELHCTVCNQVIHAAANMTAAQVADYTQRSYGKILCAQCARSEKDRRAAEAAATDVLGGGTDASDSE